MVALYRRWFRQGLVGDAAYHFCIVRALKRRWWGYHGVPEFVMRPGVDRYPVLFHRFAAVFPLEMLGRWQFLPNAVLFVGSVGLFGLLLAGQPQVSEQQLLVAIAVFLFAPSNLAFTDDAVLYISLSERLLARVSTGLHFYAVVIWMLDGRIEYGVIAALCGAVALMTSKFARQALLFTTPLFALLAWNPLPMVALACSILMAAALQREFFILGLRDQVGFSQAYARFTKRGQILKGMLSSFIDIRKLFDSRISLRSRLADLQRREPSQLLFRMPEAIALAVLGLQGEVPMPFLALLGATIAVYLLTATAALRQFGEAVRYVEYNVAFAASAGIALAHMPGTYPVLVFALMAWGAVIGAWKVWEHLRRGLPDHDRLAEFLSRCDLAPDDLVLCIPINLAPSVTARTGMATICYPGNYGVWMYEDYVEEYPYPKQNWRAIGVRHGVTKVLVTRQALLDVHRSMGWQYNFDGLRTIAEDEIYVCYAAEPLPSQTPVHSLQVTPISVAVPRG